MINLISTELFFHCRKNGVTIVEKLQKNKMISVKSEQSSSPNDMKNDSISSETIPISQMQQKINSGLMKSWLIPTFR